VKLWWANGADLKGALQPCADCDGYTTLNHAMKITYPADRTVSVWIGTFSTEDDLEESVADSVESELPEDTDIVDICEAAYEEEEVPVIELLTGFSGWETFIAAAVAAAAARGLTKANGALVCYDLECSGAPDQWGGLAFLGSFPGWGEE
jgi:hypothetical protein